MDLQILRQEVLDCIENNILPFWLNFQDEENGGFYGRMTGEGQLVKDATKGGILNARILWSFSAAYRVLGKPEYLNAATRAKDYILQHFIDRVYGGTYWELDCKGNPVDTKKQFYAIGFTIYGLTEYVRATGDSEALKMALQLYDCIEEHSVDHQYNGYIEACTREWGKIADMRLSDLDANYPKSQNTHLHIIEPYTNLYRCMKELKAKSLLQDIATPAVMNRVEGSLRNLIDIFCNRILNPETHHLDLFFDMDWSRGAGRLESYGHDIECSWLIHEAALVLAESPHHPSALNPQPSTLNPQLSTLNSQLLKRVEPIVQLVAKASEKGLNADGSMTHEANLDTGYVDTDRHWWVQAETVVGFYNIYQYFHDDSALDKALRCWQYIKDNLLDHELGEWFWSRDPQCNVNRHDDHAGFWKCPYHNSRMCLELIERIK